MGAGGLDVLDGFDRLRFLDGPTPIQRLHRLERQLGPALGGTRLYVKRDDQMALGGGGNKLRKLEFLLGAAVREGCDTFIPTGGVQSNHARLSAAASAYAGLACELVLARVVARDDPSYRRNGNMLLDGLFGATVHELDATADTLAFAHERARALKAEGRSAYVVGVGGSSPLGSLGYADCAREIAAQEAALSERFEKIVVANGSAGSHAGLAAGFAAMGQDPALIRSFTVLAPEQDARRTTTALAQDILALLGAQAKITPDGIDVSGAERGEGYGIPTAAMLATVRLMARAEGLLLDPVYSGKAFAGFLSDACNGAYGEGKAALFVMTGGVPGLFAYQPAFETDAF